MKNNIKKNKQILKNIFQPVIYFTFSIIIATVILFILYKNALNFYNNNYLSENIIVNTISTFIYYKNNFFGDIVYLFILLLIAIPIYLSIMYKKSKNLITILDAVEDM